MSKHLNCRTIICKVNGITILNLNNSKTEESTDQYFDKNGSNQLQTETDGKQMDYKHSDEDQSDDNKEDNKDIIVENEKQLESKPLTKVFKMEKVENGIESVRQHVLTTRRYGKVWHQCKWETNAGVNCTYGSKWSGAMVNHIRSHLGVKPFRCSYCQKLFTIACNLKNHLRIHHGLKAKIISNGGRRQKADKGLQNKPQSKPRTHKYAGSSKLRIFKPSFVNGSTDNDPYAPQTHVRRSGRKTKSQRSYEEIDEEIEEEFLIESSDKQLNEEMAEEDNRMFYEQTVEEEEYEDEDHTEDDVSKFIIKRRYNKNLWFVCIWNPMHCKYRSHQRSALLLHVKKHLNFLPYRCNWNHCTASFRDNCQLVSHQLIHKRQKPLRCNFPNCFFSTVNASAMKMHKIRHLRTKGFVCSVSDCNLKFSSKVNLIRHMKTHSIIKC